MVIFLLNSRQSSFQFEGPAEHIGSGYVMPEHFKSTEGRVKKPIISKKFQPIGQFVIDYLVIRPIMENPDGRKEKASKSETTNNIDANSTPKLECATTLGAYESQVKSNNNASSSNSSKSKCNFKVTYAKHWKSNWKGIEVAHRGLGNSYTKSQR